MNAYTGMLSWESVRSTWQQVRLSRLARVVGVLLISGVAMVLALLGWRSFVTIFSNFLETEFPVIFNAAFIAFWRGDIWSYMMLQ